MNSFTSIRGGAIAAVAALLVAGVGVSPAAARQDPGTLGGSSISSAQPGGCPLTRVGTQFMRCDNLTGAGVRAPAWIPEG
ncbi:hypothetical protein QMG83_12225 [Salinibacterium sp. G-O1]|uniref:hypothetical protein n=1 Tax=Salinibacterium sp. G-O1 TaxID=3046208 RepID=UPI0024BAD3F4|nr:hypothetical protein [Salinibacterium sp. G-O1]MDJ0335993.1 hypothetical protein [Salinibacterium sp. G-O1]